MLQIILVLYGSAYIPALNSVRIAVWYTAFSYLGGARNAWIVSGGWQKYLKYLQMCLMKTKSSKNRIYFLSKCHLY